MGCRTEDIGRKTLDLYWLLTPFLALRRRIRYYKTGLSRNQVFESRCPNSGHLGRSFVLKSPIYWRRVLLSFSKTFFQVLQTDLLVLAEKFIEIEEEHHKIHRVFHDPVENPPHARFVFTKRRCFHVSDRFA